jgi:hypothetical protein
MLYVLLGLASLAAYGMLWPGAPVMEGDSPQYLEVARDLRDFRIDEIHDRTPGYPALLALTGSTDAPTRALFYASLLIHFGSVWLLALALHASGASARSLTAFGILLTLPPYVEPAGYVMTENLAQFALAAGLTGLVMWFRARRAAWLVAASLAIGYAGFTRPVYQMLAFALAAGLALFPGIVRRLGLTYRDAVTAAAVLVLGSVVILGGLCVRNLTAFGYFGVAPTFGFHLSTKTTSVLERLPDEYAVARDILIRERDAQLVKPGGKHNGTQAIWHARDELSRATGLSTPQLSAYLVKMNLRLIAQSPLEYLEEVGRAFAAYWFPATGPLASMGSSTLRWLWALLHLSVVAVLIMTPGVLLRSMPRRLPGPLHMHVAWLLSAAIVIYTMLLSCFLDIGEPRQRRPTDVLLLFMCFAAAHLWNRLRQSAATSGGIA